MTFDPQNKQIFAHLSGFDLWPNYIIVCASSKHTPNNKSNLWPQYSRIWAGFPAQNPSDGVPSLNPKLLTKSLDLRNPRQNPKSTKTPKPEIPKTPNPESSKDSRTRILQRSQKPRPKRKQLNRDSRKPWPSALLSQSQLTRFSYFLSH